MVIWYKVAGIGFIVEGRMYRVEGVGFMIEGMRFRIEV